ncbi:MAG TPA: S-layer homology domain-containing protein [Syntrophomonadaceae bacterium]|nr:S-layer homology domain-containing protein [Syntrophomonadaceae bacterium]HPR92731.1 S-layer homology domain-containing protein [Syntrophomonadaceae bacterium]
MKKKSFFVSLFLIMSMMAMLFSPSGLAAPACADAAVIGPGIDPGIIIPDLFVPVSIEVTPGSQSVVIGDTASYQCTAYNAAGASRDYTESCEWHINAASIAANLGDGDFRGLSAGTTQVWATVEARDLLSNRSNLTVTANGDPKLVIEPISSVIKVGESQQYRAYLRNTLSDYPNTDVTDQCDWSISEPIADLAGNGLFEGTEPGAATITAHYETTSNTLVAVVANLDLTAQARLKVEQTAVKIWLEVTPESATISVGDTQQYQAILHNSGEDSALDVTDESTWSIVDDIADITDKGLFKGEIEGESTVRAIYSPDDSSIPASLSDTAQLIVMDSPPTENLPEGKMIDRQPGYITLCAPQNLGDPGDEFLMNYNQSLMDSNPNRYPKVFYWNDTYQKWVALASYPVTAGKVNALNDGNYSGWFVVMGCIQPKFTDTSGHWAEKIANRMNGLGLLEGYPDPANPSSLIRPAGLERIIIRSELTAAVARILGLSPGDTHLYPTITYMTDSENDQILEAKYADAEQIDAWARPYIAAMTEAGLVNGKGNSFAPNDQMTRLEAAIMISNALQDVPGFGTPADLSGYTDSADIPSWAFGKVAQGTISGYPDGTLRPNQPIKRSEALTLLLTLLRGLDW